MPHLKINRARRELLVLAMLALLTTIIFWNSDLDLRMAAWFYHPENPAQPWPLQYLQPMKLLYDYAFVFIVTCGVVALLVYLFGHLHRYTERFRRRALYVLLVIVIGPGLVVNAVFKDHWGRPRPVHVKEFGGKYDYVPPGLISDSPDKSFVCGHCSVAASFVVLYFLSQNHKLLYLALSVFLLGGMGATRMTAGGHFVSDILWSGYLVFLVAYALYYGWYIELKWWRRRDG